MRLAPSFLQQRVPLADLLDLKAFEEVCRSFAELYRVGLKVFDESGNRLVDVKVGNADFCGYIFTKPLGREQCVATVGRVKSQDLGEEPKPVTFECFSGCRYVVEPVLYEGDVMGRVVFGPFVPDDQAELPVTLRRIASDFDAKLAESYVQKIRRVGVLTAEKILKHFMGLLDVMVFTGHKNLISAKLHIEAVTESYRELSEKNRQLEGLGGPLTAEQREYLGIIMEKGENLLQLITSILDISKIEAGRVRLVLTDVDAGHLMRDAVATVLPIARKKGLRVTCEPPTIPKIRADRDKLRQCLVNLCSNAVKFTPAGGTITLAANAVEGQRVAIRVSDTGIGIPEEHIDKVFDVFYQVDGSSTREYGGAGLGLAIVKSFVEAHGGEIQVRSVPDRGSTFTMVFPQRGVATAARAPHAKSAAS